MKVLFVGFGDKMDLVLTTGLLLKHFTDKPVSVVTTDMRYDAFAGEISGIRINPTEVDEEEIVLHDIVELPEEIGEEKIILVTGYEKYSVDNLKELLGKVAPIHYVILDEPSKFGSKYLESVLADTADIITYSVDRGRLIDLVYEDKVKVKGLNKDFVTAVNTIIGSLVEIDQKNLKKLWSYSAKRGE